MSEQNEPIFFEGKAGCARQVDLSELGELDFLIPFETDLEMLRFELLGDFIHSFLSSSVHRAWVHPQEHTRAMILVGPSRTTGEFGVLGVFLDTRFTDGFAHTSAVTTALKDRETKTRSRRVHTWSNVYTLFQEHKRSIELLSAEHGLAVPTDDTLLAVMQSMDDETALRAEI